MLDLLNFFKQSSTVIKVAVLVLALTPSACRLSGESIVPPEDTSSAASKTCKAAANDIVTEALKNSTPVAEASQILAGTYALTDSATPTLGTMTNHGEIAVSSFSDTLAAGYISSLSVNGDAMLAAALSDKTEIATAAACAAGKWFLGSTTTPIQGSMASNGAVAINSLAVTSYPAGYVDSITIDGDAIVSSVLASSTPVSTASQCAAGTYFLGKNGSNAVTATPILGTMTNAGAISITNASYTATAGYHTSIAVSGDSIVSNLMASSTPVSLASQCLAGTNFLGKNGASAVTATPIAGTMTDSGAITITNASTTYTAGYHSSIAVTGDTVVANLIAASAPLVANVANASECLSGKYFLGKNGANAVTATPISGTMTNQGTLTLASAFPGTGYYTGISASPTNTTVCTGTTILGVAGSGVCEGAAAAGSAGANTDICSGKYAWNSAGTGITGTRACTAPTITYSTADLKVWLKADNIDNNNNQGKTDATAIASWYDSSGNGHTFSQSSGANQPLLKIGKGGGGWAARFDGTNSYMEIAAMTASSVFASQTDLSVFLVLRQDRTAGAAAADQPVLAFKGGANASNVFSLIAPEAAGSITAVFGQIGGADPDALALAKPLYWENSLHIMSLVIAKSGTDGNVTLHIDGVETLPVIADYNGLFSNGTVSNFELGRNNVTGGATKFKGDIYELLIFSSALIPAEITKVETYLQTKYAL